MAEQQGDQVVGSLASFTGPGPTGPVKRDFYKGAWVPDGVPQAEIDHNLDVGLIAAVDDPYHTPVDGSGVETPMGTATDEIGRPTSNEPVAEEAPDDGKAKRGTKADLVEQAVAAGMDRGEAEKASVADLRAALKG